MTTSTKVISVPKTYVKKKIRKDFITVSTHVTSDELATVKRLLASEGTTLYSFLKKCLKEKIGKYSIDTALGLPPLPVEDDLLG